MTDDRTLLDVVRAHRDIALREAAIAAAEADILRERVAALEGAARRVTSAQVYEAPGDPCQGLDVGFVRALRLLYEVVTSPAPTPATDEADTLRERVAALEVASVMPSGASLAWHSEPHGPDTLCWGCRNHIGWHMLQCRCKEAPWCVPHPSDETHQWASLCRLPHEHVAAPTPATDEARCDGFHDFRPMTCSRCGARGNVNLSIVGEDERLDITKAQPTPEPACHLCRRTKDEHAARPDLLHTFTPEPAPRAYTTVTADDWVMAEPTSDQDDQLEAVRAGVLTYEATHCKHGTFTGHWAGPDYLCGQCEMGDEPEGGDQ